MTTSHKKINFYKLFLSYFLVFLIPTILISTIVFNTSNHILKKEIQKNNILSTQTGQYNLNQTLESFNIIGTSIAYSNFGHSIDLKTENTTATQLISYLNRTKLSYSFVDDLFLIYDEGDYIYSSSSSYTEENFYRYMKVLPYSANKLREMFTKPTQSFILPMSRSQYQDSILYVVPCMRSDYTIGSLAFSINVDLLNKFLGNRNLDNYIYLIDNQGTVLNPDPIFTKKLNTFLKNTPISTVHNDENLTISSTATHTFTFGSVINNFLHLVNVSSNEKALHSLNRFRNLTLSVLFIAFILGIICVMIAFKKSYKDFVTITSSYEDELKKILPLKRKEVLNSLINGNYMYLEDFSIQCEEIGLCFDANYHYCIIIHPKDHSFKTEDLLHSNLDTQITYNYCAKKSAEKIVYLMGSNAKMPLTTHYHDKEQYTLFISKPIHNILDIHLQYTDLMSFMYMYDYSHHHNSPSDTSIYAERLQYYDTYISKINSFLSTSDIGNLNTIKEPFILELQTDFIPFELKIKIMLQLFILFTHTIKVDYTINDILNITMVEDLSSFGHTLFDTYIQSVEAKKSTEPSSLNVESIKTFIEEHFTDPMFSLQFIAENYHVSNSYLSWFFKQKTGTNILDYTTNLKMNLAIELLGKNLTLQEISTQVGYINVSSFIRRFKQTMGMTPGEYKKTIK